MMNKTINLSNGKAEDFQRLETIRAHSHPCCLVCNPRHPAGMGQKFVLQADGSVQSIFNGGKMFEGYSGLLHGGVAALLLDGAMTNCLFAHGVRALTAELTVRYHEPVSVHKKITTCARLCKSRGRLYLLQAELMQGGRVKAAASAKFIENHE